MLKGTAARIILISARRPFIKEAKSYFPTSGIEILSATGNAAAAIEKICGGADAVVSDMFIGSDEVTDIMKKCRLRMRALPPFIVLSPYVSEALFGECADLGAVYCMPDSDSLKTICERVKRAVKAERGIAMQKRNELKKIIAKLLSDMSIQSDSLGFEYLSTAIMLTITEGAQMITKDIYPAVARAFGTTPSAVERSMRLAIRRAWACGSYALQSRIFSDVIKGDRRWPTNAQFINAASKAIISENPEICIHSDI